eukprot:CAMPEP_0196821432 /NCGR_PEP_ID=MMETSP1362-20130617/79204_1 /TAXON_ID=163516 /ORGANISM="Leptocylindrus danicus, Strain CCMP1856" /LENGTH=144 /DNA_ID=CAMNT_0042200607 /DNA_START=217 /DNA_END=648 /DNA_ORIENTATION=-
MLTSASIVRTLEEEEHEHAAVSLSDSEFESRCNVSNHRNHSEPNSSDEEFPLLRGKRLCGSDGDECSLELENRNKRSRRANGDFTTPHQWYSYNSAAYWIEHNSGEQDNSSPNSSNLLSRRISPDSSPKSKNIRKTPDVATKST